MTGHDIECGAVWIATEHAWTPCDCAARADTHRIQTENADRLRAATDPEKDDVLMWLNDNCPDVLREAMDETC